MNSKRTLGFLMANVGSEITRLFSNVENKEYAMATGSAKRAEAIISEMLAHPDIEGRRGEVLILQDIIRDLLKTERTLDVQKEEMEEYFLPFALRAMSQ